MEKENEIKNDFDKTRPNPFQEGNDIGRENGIDGGDDAKGSAQEHGANDGKEDGDSSVGLEKIRKKKMTPKKFLKITVLFILFLIAWFAVVQYLAADKYEAVVKVMEKGEQIGVNPTTERLDYGDLPKGSASTRFVTIENSGNMDIYVLVLKFGEIAELIRVNRNNFVLESGEKEKLELSLEMPISADKEEYTGKVLIFKLPKVF